MKYDREDFLFISLFCLKNDGWKLAAPFITFESEQLVRLPHAPSRMEAAFNKTVIQSEQIQSFLFFCHQDGRRRSNNHMLIKHRH